MRAPLVAALITTLAAAPAAAQEILLTEAGAGPTGLPGSAANVAYPGALDLDSSGELLILAYGLLLKLDTSGTVQVLAGEGTGCTSPPYGDGGSALNSCLGVGGLTQDLPRGIARDASGNIYIADTGHHVIRKIDPTMGTITRWAGVYTGSYTGDGGPASAAALYRPHQIVLDTAGNIFIADRGNHRVRKVSAGTGIITTVAGTGIATNSIDGPNGNPADNLGDGLPSTGATLRLPYGVALDAAGNLYIGDSGNYRVRKVSAATGIITTIAGDGTPGYSGEDVPGTMATLAGPASLSIDAAGNLLIADSQWDLRNVRPEDDQSNHRVRRLNLATGIISTVAGTDGFAFSGSVGDGGPATSAALYRPSHAISDAAGNLYIADQYHQRVRKVTASTGLIDTLAGNGTRSYAGDGYPGLYASLSSAGLKFDTAGNLLIADAGNSRIRTMDAVTGTITTIAGTGVNKTSGDGGQATLAAIEVPLGLALDTAGNIYVADGGADRVRKITKATGVITTVAGNGTYGYGGDGGQATQAALAFPVAVAVNTAGDLFIADSDNSRVRKVSAATGVITTFAGTGWGWSELDGPGGNAADDVIDGGPATGSSVSYPSDVLLDAEGNLLIADAANRVRKVTPGGVLTTIAGNGSSVVSGDGGPAINAGARPGQLALDLSGNVYFTDYRRIRRVDHGTGVITTWLGNGVSSFAPDGSAPPTATILGGNGIAVDGSGKVHYGESGCYRIRTLDPAPGSSHVPDGSMAGEAPLTVTRAANGDLTMSWAPSCMFTDFDYAVYEGTLGSFPSHVPRFCSTGGVRSKTFTPAAGSAYYLVVPRNGAEEGSYGLASNGTQTPASASACVPQHIATACQ